MIEKFAGVRGLVRSEFLDLNHTSKPMILVSLVIPKFAPSLASSTGELRNRDTSVMIEKFAGARGLVRSEFLDLNHTSKPMILVSLVIPKFAPEPGVEHRRTSKSGH